MKAIRNAVDRLALRYIRRRLAQFQKRGDVHDQFGDSIAALLTAEISRRNKLLAGWDAELKAAELARAESERRAAAMQAFEGLSLEHQRKGLHLQ